MKKTIAALLMAGIFSLPAMAQYKQDRSPEQKAMMMTSMMEKELGLSSEQKESVYQANLEMASAMKEDRANAHKAHQTKLKEILTEEQYIKLEQLQKERRKERKHRRMDGAMEKE